MRKGDGMNNQPLPPDLQRRWGHLADIRYHGGGEWSSACPTCGGATGSRRDPSDRFRMWEADPQKGLGARAWCRQGCNGGKIIFADDDLDYEYDPAVVMATTAERLRLSELENQRIREKLQRIGDADFWMRWHNDMEPSHIDLWKQQGIVDYFINYYKLGYCADHTTYYNGIEYHSPTMTIPHYGPNWKLTNIQHRLLNPPVAGDKYRQMAGVPSAMFLTEPDQPLSGQVLVVEGAKKAIVIYTHLGNDAGQIVAVPSKTPSAEMLELFVNCDPVYLALDPDAYKGHVQRIAERLGPERVRFVHFPAKPDDLLVEYGLEGRDLIKYIKRATVTV